MAAGFNSFDHSGACAFGHSGANARGGGANIWKVDASGNVLWSYNTDSSLLFSHYSRGQLFAVDASKTYVLDSDGGLVRTVPFGGQYICYAIVGSTDIIYCATNMGFASRRTASGALVWNAGYSDGTSLGVLSDGRVYCGRTLYLGGLGGIQGSERKLLDAATGAIVAGPVFVQSRYGYRFWQAETGGNVYEGIMSVNPATLQPVVVGGTGFPANGGDFEGDGGSGLYAAGPRTLFPAPGDYAVIKLNAALNALWTRTARYSRAVGVTPQGPVAGCSNALGIYPRIDESLIAWDHDGNQRWRLNLGIDIGCVDGDGLGNVYASAGGGL